MSLTRTELFCIHTLTLSLKQHAKNRFSAQLRLVALNRNINARKQESAGGGAAFALRTAAVAAKAAAAFAGEDEATKAVELPAPDSAAGTKEAFNK